MQKKISGSISECSGLIGNKKVVQRLAEEIAVLENKKMNVVMEQGVYALQQVKKKWTEEGFFEK